MVQTEKQTKSKPPRKNKSLLPAGQPRITAAQWREFKNDGIPLGADMPKGYED